MPIARLKLTLYLLLCLCVPLPGSAWADAAFQQQLALISAAFAHPLLTVKQQQPFVFQTMDLFERALINQEVTRFHSYKNHRIPLLTQTQKNLKSLIKPDKSVSAHISNLAASGLRLKLNPQWVATTRFRVDRFHIDDGHSLGLVAAFSFYF